MREEDMEAFIDSLERSEKGNCSKQQLGEEERQMAAVWKELGAMADAKSRDDKLVSNFKNKLQAYKQGFSEADKVHVSKGKAVSLSKAKPSVLVSFFRYAAVGGVAAALALSGYIAISQTERNNELEHRLASTQETLALALLDQPSAPKRLAGLAAATEVSRPSERLQASMLRTFDLDTNLNVRLAAVSAIANLPKEQAIAVLLERMEHEESALVQAEILRQVIALTSNGSNEEMLRRIEAMTLEPRLRKAIGSNNDKI